MKILFSLSESWHSHHSNEPKNQYVKLFIYYSPDHNYPTVKIDPPYPINGSRCHSITFNFSEKNTPPTNLTLQGNNILPCDFIKLIGVVLSKDLKWTENTQSIRSKVNQSFFYLYKSKQFGFQKYELVTAWCAIIRPLVEYAAPLWHSGLTETDSKKLEVLQKGPWL